MASTNRKPGEQTRYDNTQEVTERLPVVKPTAQFKPSLRLPTTPPPHPLPSDAPVLARAYQDEDTRLLAAFHFPQPTHKNRRWALVSLLVLGIILFHALNLGALQFMGSQGWAYVLGGPVDTSNTNLLKDINKNLHNSTATKNAHMTPQQYVNMVVHGMTLDQKLGQMMLVQFNGATYSYALSTMISQYHIGSVMLFTVNGNVVGQTQLKGLVQQMQQDSGPIPLGVAIDQEGGAVDRLVHLDGPRPSEASIGATNMPAQATAAGMQDAKDLTSYGINMNLAPVVDVDNNVASELHVDQRTYGSNPATVIKMSSAYLKGLQQSGKVVGTLKHFPGLGDVVGDPHAGIPHLTRSKQALEQIDWAPYRALIKQGNVASIMVTHEVVDAIDSSKPASLSSAMIQGILRQDLGFKGVVMTDSLTMAGITDTYTPGQAAALSIEAGADMIMGAASPGDVASMIDNIKQEMTAGKITPQRIDDAVSRILMMKYKMGLITLP